MPVAIWAPDGEPVVAQKRAEAVTRGDGAGSRLDLRVARILAGRAVAAVRIGMNGVRCGRAALGMAARLGMRSQPLRDQAERRQNGEHDNCVSTASFHRECYGASSRGKVKRVATSGEIFSAPAFADAAARPPSPLARRIPGAHLIRKTLTRPRRAPCFPAEGRDAATSVKVRPGPPPQSPPATSGTLVTPNARRRRDRRGSGNPAGRRRDSDRRDARACFGCSPARRSCARSAQDDGRRSA